MSKIKIRMGEIEVEYEGAEEFLKAELPALLKAVADLHREAAPSKPSKPVAGLQQPSVGVSSTSQIAGRLGGGSGTDLLLAAAIKLSVVDGLDSFSRDALHGEMKTAKSYYKATYSKNLSGYFKTLVRDHKLNELGNESYALAEDERTAASARLSGE